MENPGGRFRGCGGAGGGCPAGRVLRRGLERAADVDPLRMPHAARTA